MIFFVGNTDFEWFRFLRSRSPEDINFWQPGGKLRFHAIHHAAFDKNIIGITPDYFVHVRDDILEETDGPMLKYGLQSLENEKIILPYHQRDYPDKERLEARYQIFRRA